MTNEQKEKLEIIPEKIDIMKECGKFDVVLLMKEGEIVSRFVLQRINAAYLFK